MESATQVFQSQYVTTIISAKESDLQGHPGELEGISSRGRKASAWVVHVYAELMDEFLRLRKTGLNSHYIDPLDNNKLIQDKITT